LSPLIIGHEGGAWWESGVCWAPIAGAAAPNVKPPANAAPLLSSDLRFSGFEPMRLSFADEANEEIACGRKYTPIAASVLTDRTASAPDGPVTNSSKLTYASSDTAVATVNASGTVTAAELG